MVAHLSRPARFITLIFAALQFALPGVASIVDGASARANDTVTAHVEDVAHRGCKPPHSADCAICRYLTGTFSTPATTPAPIPSLQVCSNPGAVVTSCTRAELHGFNSRAPPILLD
jgi:hypothetical protein